MLKGAAALLRPLRASDRAISVRWRNDPEIRDNTLGYRFPVTEESEADWIKGVLLDRSQSRLVLAIEDASDRALVGFIYLNHIDWFARNAEIGILIGDRSRQRRGLARDALALIAAYGFETLNLNKLFLRVVASNKPALLLYSNFGFVQEGIQRQQAFTRGRFRDVILMGLLRRDFRAASSLQRRGTRPRPRR